MSISQCDIEQLNVDDSVQDDLDLDDEKKMKLLKQCSRKIDDLVYKYSSLLFHYNESVYLLCENYKNGCNQYNRKIGIVNNKMKEKQKSIEKFNELILKVDSKNPQIREKKIEKLKFSLDLEIETLKSLNVEKDALLKEMIKYEHDTNPNTDLRLKEMLETMGDVKKQYSSAIKEYKRLRSTMK